MGYNKKKHYESSIKNEKKKIFLRIKNIYKMKIGKPSNIWKVYMYAKVFMLM